MVVVPKAGSAHAFPVAAPTQPIRRGRIHGRVPISTQKTNEVAFDHGALTVRTGFIVDVQPQKRHGADIQTDPCFEVGFGLLDFGAVHTELAGGSTRATADTPGWRQREVLVTGERYSCKRAEDRASVTAAAMLRQSLPQRGP